MASLLTVFGCNFSRSATSRLVRISSPMGANFSIPSAQIQLTTPPKREITHELNWVMECETEIDTQPCSAGKLWRRTAYFITRYELSSTFWTAFFLDRAPFDFKSLLSAPARSFV